MSITSFDHFIETLENVPAELRRNFHLMTDLDKRSFDLIKRINECVREYRNTGLKDERINLFKESMDLFDKARSFADDKVDLAMQTYDLVDKHIRRLECINVPSSGDTTNATQTATSSSNNKNQKSKSSRDKAKSNNNISSGTSPNVPTVAETLAVDMPLDPNEPRYCTCHQVSFGEMIACDNSECPIEWFHFACVDLKTKPKGKWYCPECFNINKKGKHKLKRHKG